MTGSSSLVRQHRLANLLSTMRKPTRLRSQIVVIIYKAKLPLDKLISHIQSFIKDIKYIAKHEYYTDMTTETIVYIDFKKRPDIQTKKLEFNSTDFSLWATNDSFWPLTLILKLSDDSIETNINKSVIDRYIKRLCVDSGKKTVKKTKLTKLPKLTEKANNKLVSLIKEHRELLKHEPLTVTQMTRIKKCLNNATNYRYKYEIPEELDKQISNMRRLMKK